MATLVKDDELRSFDVPEVTRHAGGYTIYKIVLQVTPKEITENSYQIIYWKRYSDIRKLYDTLHRYHQAIYRPGKFPDFPEKSSYMERFNPAVIEERRVATKKFLNYAVEHLYLRTHDAYINFFQKGEKLLLPDVTVDTLQPESISPKEPNISLPDLPTTVQSTSTDEKHDELLFNVDEQDAILNHPLPKILDDLNDLTFDQHDPNPDPSDLHTSTETPSIPPLNSDTNESS
ncbi:unnamed protein product [Adineta ricciae]|uniref:PX domain-containing protein n=1 Tax=Adineta ricciae TaxID=249248 RepID=A0A814AF10_ADIRI|nr:unnamed protein product [Adineta ricciae]CAF0914194.1 unnamed protein product [Adineta ricciae]